MRRFLYAVAALGALAGSGPAWAVLEETTVTLTDHGEPLPGSTVTLTRTDDQPAPQPKTEKTDETGKVVLVHEKEDTTSDKTVELTVTTPEGKTLTRRVTLTSLLTSKSIDVAQPSEARPTPESSREASAECTNLSHLTDSQLREIVNEPELRTRIVKLMDETRDTREVQEKRPGKSQEERTVHRKGRTVAEPRRRGKRYQPVGSPVEPDRSAAGDAVRTGLGIIIGTGVGTMGRYSGQFHGMPKGERMQQREMTPARGRQREMTPAGSPAGE